jgi:hypothetical protein
MRPNPDQQTVEGDGFQEDPLARFRIGALAIGSLLAITVSATPALAEGGQTYYLGELTNAGLDTGYSEYNQVEQDDPQYGWSLGAFYVTGFTSVSRDETPTFLKLADDTVSLHFRLDQDIDALNGNGSLSIADDANGYDQSFEVDKQDFGRGTFIVRQTDYQNSKSAPQIYVDFLASTVSENADTEVQLFEEGDYEATLDYEIRNDPRKVPFFGVSILPEYTDYHITFSFSVRNGNTMVFLFDSSTGSELTNESLTENGFTIDMAKSRYLDVNVKREVMAEGRDELVEDVRSNAPAEDGKQYTDEGIYTITATNPTTGEITEKKIYVGTDPVMKAYAVTGYSIEEIENKIAQGAQIDDDGTITWPTAKAGSEPPATPDSANAAEPAEDNRSISMPTIIAAVVAIAALAIVAFLRGRGDASNGTGDPGIPNNPNESIRSQEKDGDHAE